MAYLRFGDQGGKAGPGISIRTFCCGVEAMSYLQTLENARRISLELAVRRCLPQKAVFFFAKFASRGRFPNVFFFSEFALRRRLRSRIFLNKVRSSRVVL